MKKVYAYIVGAVMIASSVILSPGCSKSTTADATLIGNWKRTDDFEGLARSEAVSFSIGNYGYVCTGTATIDRFRDLWQYDPAQRNWSQMADLPGAARNSAVAFSIGTKAYVGTGYDGSNMLTDFWEYDQTTNQWTEKADFAGGARYDAVGFAVNGKGYIGCGFDGNYLKDIWEYTPGTTVADPGVWVHKASVGGSKRSAAMAFVVNNNAYIMGGNNNGEIQQDLWEYDQTNNIWNEKAKVYNYSTDTYDDSYGTIPRQNAVTLVMNGLVYLSTGENGAITSITWQYDPGSDRWTQKTAFEATARTGAVAFTIGTRGFVVTGRNGSLVMDNAYEFLPNDAKVDND
jgi:N-acetylneuraminic acid mutarotase